jgi:hypothetical protein
MGKHTPVAVAEAVALDPVPTVGGAVVDGPASVDTVEVEM